MLLAIIIKVGRFVKKVGVRACAAGFGVSGPRRELGTKAQPKRSGGVGVSLHNSSLHRVGDCAYCIEPEGGKGERGARLD
jgi:hypothetical protein